MKILHFYPKSDSMITKYVNILHDTMGKYADVMTSDNLLSFKKSIRNERPDLIHLHGCWNGTTALAARTAASKGIRYVLTPHGQLEPWVMKQNYWSDKLPKSLIYQKRTVRKAYSVIAMGRMEESYIKRLGWNPRIETVRNSIITESVSEEEMCRMMYAIYRKVLDSDVLKLMDEDTEDALVALIKTGQTGDHRWLTDKEYGLPGNLDNEAWRQIIIYSHQERILDTVKRGIQAVGLNILDINPTIIPCYYPTRFIPTEPLMPAPTAGKDRNKTLVTMIKTAQKKVSRGRLTISNVVELSAFLRAGGIDDDKVALALDEAGLTKFAGKLMGILAEMAGLTEGFMPVPEGSGTGKIRRIITNHLKI